MVNPQLIIDFVNTLDLRPRQEELHTPAALRGWLVGRGLLAAGARVTQADLEDARTVREALRTLLAAQNGISVDADAAAAEVDAAARRAGLSVRFAAGAAHYEPRAAGAKGAIGRILGDVSAAMADGTWSRLKACRADDCLWAFADTAKNQSRAWCSMSSCGNRAKVRAYRARHA
jgi:predicted RNA-binding Zn ribbon-like protein